MKLYYAKASPFTRKVLINAIETGLRPLVETIDVAPKSTFSLPPGYERINPLFKIPALQISEDEVIVNSPIICEYLDSISDARRLLPSAGPERFQQLKFQALADGLADATVLRRYESLREPHLQSPKADQKQKDKAYATLKFFDSQVSLFRNPYLIGEVALMCALGYVDLRFPHENWRAENPRLAEWYARVQSWAPFAETKPE